MPQGQRIPVDCPDNGTLEEGGLCGFQTHEHISCTVDGKLYRININESNPAFLELRHIP